jgi:hypothetical protein
MKNKDIIDINDFKSRMKKLYEYRIHDLNLNKEESVYRVQEDENSQKPPQEPVENQAPVEKPLPTPAPQPQQNQAPVEQKPVSTPVPQPAPQQNNQEEVSLMSYLKTEMGKLDNVITSLENISMNVDTVSKRLDSLTNIVDEIKEPSDVEKLEMRAFDSYPYNQNLNKVWGDKMKSKEEQDMERMGVYKTDNGFEMEYTPQRNFNHNQSSNNF